MTVEEKKLLDDAKRIIIEKKDVSGGMVEIKKVMKVFKKNYMKKDKN